MKKSERTLTPFMRENAINPKPLNRNHHICVKCAETDEHETSIDDCLEIT